MAYSSTGRTVFSNLDCDGGITMAKQLRNIIIIKAKVCSSQQFIINGKGEHCLTEDAVLLDESGNGPPSVERSLT